MLINCPKCDVAYTIDPTLIPDEGRKLRCTNCGEVFLCDPSDLEYPTKLVPQEQPATFANPQNTTQSDELHEEVIIQESIAIENPDTIIALELGEEPEIQLASSGTTPADMQNIFQRLSEQSQKIQQQEKQLSAFRKCCHSLRRTLGWDSRSTRVIFYLTLLLILLLSLYYSRFEIVRIFPQAKSAYDWAGIESTIPGEGLVFSNISRRQFEVDYVQQMEIKGFIDNQTNHAILVPDIHLEILDKNAEMIQALDAPAPIAKIAPHSREPFNVVVKKPSPLSKYILLTFSGSNTGK